MAKNDTRVISDFSVGEFGTIDPAKAPEGSITGINMILYWDGSLGPRPGLRRLDLGRVIDGTITGIGFMDTKLYPRLIYFEQTAGQGLVSKVWAARLPLRDPAYPLSTDLGNVDHGTPGQPLLLQDINGQQAFLVPYGTTTGYVIAPNGYSLADPVTVKPTAPFPGGGNTVGAVHGGRAYASKSGATQYGARIDYSEFGDLTAWPAANFFNLPTATQIAWMGSQRGSLTIITKDGQVYVLTGSPDTGTLRRVADAKYSPPEIQYAGCVAAGGDLVHFLNPTNNYPTMFDGVRLIELPHLTLTPLEPKDSYGHDQTPAITLRAFVCRGGTVAYKMSRNNGMMLQIGIGWYRQNLEVQMEEHWISDRRGNFFTFDLGNDFAYMCNTRLERPAFVSDLDAQPGDNSDTPLDASFQVPDYWSESGDEVLVKEVVVDINRWNTGTLVDNQLIVTVTALGRGSEQAEFSQARTWTQPVGSSPATFKGKPDRIRFGYYSQGPGAGYRIELSGIRGISVRQIHVITETQQSNSRLY